MYKEDEFEIGDRVFCVKPHKNLQPGYSYPITGCGDLTWNAATDKSGYGFCVTSEVYNYPDKKAIVNNYYYTMEEINEYFIHTENIEAYERDCKINSILNERD